MITPLMKLLIAIVLIYLLITIFMKFTKMILRVAIALLIIGIFVLGYQSVGEMWSKSPTQALEDQWTEKEEHVNPIVPDNAAGPSAPAETPAGTMEEDLASLDKDLAELDDLEKELDASDMEINSTEVNETI
ncbi:MAG: hypothetical protein V1906_03775 [Candidatus Woesearchaeota archaeon]